ncbi:hypothetical protein BZK31_03405 [Pseudomonas floridensis]|uniref:Minor tail T domain-containing protein n=2 Tax=Pseudomonas floridensis TaxID=1958950 RepID=A0A1X0NB82_9PSED|nr:hypothetical protein BZK31_03405 [Pseudomonas floridensis]
MALALRLGMTLQDLRERMSAEELLLWMAFNRESPISDVRGDVQASIIAAAAFQSQGAKVSALDVLPQWGATELPSLNDDEEATVGESAFKAFLIHASETS